MKNPLRKLATGGLYVVHAIDIAGRWFWHKILVAWVKTTGRSNFALARLLLCVATIVIVAHDLWLGVTQDSMSPPFRMLGAALWTWIVWHRYKRINRIEDAVRNSMETGRIPITIMVDIKACVWDRCVWSGFILGFVIVSLATGGYIDFFLYGLFLTVGAMFVATDIDLGGKSAFATAQKKAKAAWNKARSWRPSLPPVPVPAPVGLVSTFSRSTNG